MSEMKANFDITNSTNFQTHNPTGFSSFEEADPNNPETLLIRNSQYRNIYAQFVKNNQKMYPVMRSSKQKNQQIFIKDFISRSLDVKKKTVEFQDKFSSEYKINNKKHVMTLINKLNTISSKIGETSQQKRNENKTLFFSQTKKVLQLEEQCMLLEYYYKDKNEFSTKNQPNVSIDYLKNRNLQSNRHNRFQKDKKQKNKLFLTHNEQYYQKVKKISYVSQQKFKTETFKKAQLNYTFKRQKNFAQMEQITKQNRQNLLLQSNNILNSDQIKQKQVLFNKTIRLFLKFAYIQQTKRSYYDYIDEEGIQKLIDFIIQNQFSSKIKQKNLKQIITKITKYKIQNRLELFDFLQLFQTIDQTQNIKLLNLITQKYPEYFIRSQEKLISNNFIDIKKQLNTCKYNFILKLLFQKSGKLVLNQFLPVKAIPRIFSNIGITGNELPRAKLLEIMYWNQRRPQGLNYSEFYFSFLMLGVKDDSYEYIFKIIQKIKIKELLQ